MAVLPIEQSLVVVIEKSFLPGITLFQSAIGNERRNTIIESSIIFFRRELRRDTET